ncbi:MAG TPA: hypothetical protein ENN65_03090 [Candidatus Hydrogenedentes bacterium]|nr:hypothetical protein [Candidatus Hydrogenedentota bacterium]
MLICPPHPTPLPMGEGATAFHRFRHKLPLPLGEGRGEGNKTGHLGTRANDVSGIPTERLAHRKGP